MALKRKSLLFGALGAIAGIGLGGAVAAVWLSQQRSMQAGAPFAADLIPQSALATITFTTDEGQWQALQRFGTAETRAIASKALTQWRDQFLTANGLNYQQDIQPWIGETVTVAMVSIVPDREGETPTEPVPLGVEQQSTVALLPIADAAAAQTSLVPASATAQPTYRDYKGVQIGTTQSEQATSAFAVLGRTIAVSPNERAIEQVIDTYKGADSVADTQGYLRAFERIGTANPLAQIYINSPKAKEWMLARSSQGALSAWMLPLQHNQGMAATVALTSNGLRLQGLNWLTSESEIRYQTPDAPDRIPNVLPADTLLMVSGSDLQQFWQRYTQQSGAAPEALANPNTLKEAIHNTTELDIDQDLTPWMQGEFSVAVLPTTKAANNAPGVGVALLTEVSDRAAADATFAKLDQVMGDRYQFQVTQAQLNGAPSVNWVSKFGSVSASRGWLDGNLMFLVLDTSLTKAITPTPTSTLADNDLFQQATASDLETQEGHFFVNLDRLLSSNVPLPTLPPNIDAVLKATRAIGVTTAIQSDRSTRYDLSVLLRQEGGASTTPAPLPEAPQ